MSAPLTAEAIEDRLEELVGTVLSSRRTATDVAKTLAMFTREQQDFLLHWIRVVAASNAELGFQFAQYAAKILPRAQPADIEAWAVHAMDVFDQSALHAAVACIHNVDSFLEKRLALSAGLPLQDVAGVLRNFLQGLHGRKLKLADDARTYTDTETIFLPAVAGQFSERDDNFRWYKACVAFLWAQAYYGTWNAQVERVVGEFPDAERALRVFQTLEAIRLDACIERELPGVWRDMARLRQLRGESLCSNAYASHESRLRAVHASVRDSVELLRQMYEQPVGHAVSYAGEMIPARVADVREARIARERNAMHTAVARLLADERTRDIQPIARDDGGTARLRAVRTDTADGFTFELQLDGQPVMPPDDVQSLIASIIQDIEQIPEDYLVPAGDGPYAAETAARDPRDVWKGTYHEEGAYLYPEWDCERQQYRKNWAVLRELDGHPQWDDFPRRTLQKYRATVVQLRRSFEALRGDEKLLKRQHVGDDVDIDAAIEAYADGLSGLELSDRVFLKRRKIERDIAVMFMVDMSGSTKGWINDAEREARLLLCEALESLGDRYAIYGFTSLTHKRCEVVRIKRFDEVYSETVQARIAGITPQDYTRMGAPIRHLTKMLGYVDARTKLLVTISDGKPDDFDVYRGRYGIEDTRQALIEARRTGAHVFCITIDTEAKEYLPHMYGAVNYVVVDQVAKLPFKLSDIYRKLTA